MDSQKANDPNSVASPQVEKLQEQFMDLQQEWESYKQSNPKTKRRSYSSSSRTMAKTIDQLLDNSPRHLMSSLQHRMPPLEGDYWNVRTNDLAVEEIKRDRRAAIESGMFKGRRLFGDEHEESEMCYGGEKSKWGSWDWDQESEVRSLSFSLSGDDHDEVESGKSKQIKVCFQDSITCLISSPCGENMKDEKEKVVFMEEKKVVENKGGSRAIVVIIPVLAIAALIVALCRIRGLFGFRNVHYEPILVPT